MASNGGAGGNNYPPPPPLTMMHQHDALKAIESAFLQHHHQQQQQQQQQHAQGQQSQQHPLHNHPAAAAAMAAGLGYPGFQHLGGVSGLHPENSRSNNSQENHVRSGVGATGSQDTTTQNPHHQNYQQHQQQQQFERSPSGNQHEETKYQPGMQSPTSSENQLGRPPIGDTTSTNNMNLNSSLGSQNSISNDSQENIGNAARGQSIQGRLAGTSIDPEVNGSDEVTEDDGSDLLSEMEMKARMGKVENGPQHISDPKQFKGANDRNSQNNEESCFNQEGVIKGENESDSLQFPLGVRIKKEVLDPREEGSDYDELDLDNINGKVRKPGKSQNTGQRSNVIGKVPRSVENKANTEEDSIEILKKAVSEISDVSQIWKVVRSRVLSQCQIWDLLMDKACFQYYGETSNTEDTKNIGTLNSNEAQRSTRTNSRKFKVVVTEMEALLGEFKCLMDGCLDTKSSAEDKNEVQKSNNNPESDANNEINNSDTSSTALKNSDELVSLSPELARAYEKPLDTRWKIKDQSSINALYQQFFSFNGEDQERRNLMDMMNMDTFGNSFMPFPQKFDESADEGDFDDEDEEFEFEEEDGGYELDDDYDEGDMLDVKPPIGVKEGDVPGMLEGSESKRVLRHRKKVRTRDRGAYSSVKSSIYVHECPKCHRRYKHSNNLRRHTSKCTGQPQATDACQWKRNSEGRYICAVEGCEDKERSWSTTSGVWKHFNANHATDEDLVFHCDYCAAKFPNKNLLNYHRKTKHLTRYACEECGKEFHSQQVLDRHLQTHEVGEDGENKPFQCDLCDYKTSAHNGVALHKRSAHKVDKNNQQLMIDDNPFHQDRDSKRFAFVCEKCTRRYKSMKNLTRHQRNCNGVPPPAVKPTWRKDAIDGRYYCTFEGCNSKKNWTCSSGVWKHYNAEHADLSDATYGVYQCDLCDKRFPTKTMFNQHRKHKHLSLFEYTCSVCAKRLPSNERLKLHMRQHTGEKPFKCELCEYRSATQSAVNQHKMRMHEEQSPLILQRHVCEICGKSFKVKSNLKEHIRSHSDARTFLCGFCGKALKNRQCLNRHLFTHGVKYTCHVCGKNFANPSSLNVHKRDRHGLNV